MKDKIYNTIKYVLLIIGIFIFSVFSFYSVRYTMLHLEDYSEYLTIVKDSIINNIIYFILCSAFIYLIVLLATKNNLNNYKKAHITAIIVSIIIFLQGVYIVNNFKVLPGADQAFLYTNASLLLEGNYEHLCTGSYMDMNPHQYPISFFYEILFYITGAWNYESIQYCNAFFAGIICYCGFRLCHELFENEKADLIYSFIILMCIPLYLYISFVYGEIPSIAFLLLSLWMFVYFIKSKKIRYGILFGIFMILSMLFRKHSIIFLIACILILLVYAWKENRYSFILVCIGTLLFYIISVQSIYTYMEHRSGFKIGKGIPSIAYITMGMTDNEGGPGRYNGYNQYIFGLAEFDTEKASYLAKNDLDRRMEEFKEDPIILIDFMKRKFLNQWNDPTYEGIVITDSFADENVSNYLRDNIYYGKWYNGIVDFMNLYQFLLYFSSLMFFIFIVLKKVHLYQLIILICIIGEFLFSFIWEAKGRYVFPCFVLIIPLACIGIVLMYEKIFKFLKNLVYKNRLENYGNN